MDNEKIYKSSCIYTAKGDVISGYLQVSGKYIKGVYKEDEMPKDILNNSTIVDCGNYMIMPGLIDGHTHMMPYVEKVDLSKAASIEECVEMVKNFYKEHPDISIVMGEKWYAANWGGKMPSLKDIDDIVKDVPFFASDLDIHLVWVNSKMLEKMGLSKSTLSSVLKDKKDMVDVDENGEPTGILRDEVAMSVLVNEKPKVTTETIRKMFEVWSSYGVTSVNDMDFYTADTDVFLKTKELEDNNQLNVRVFASLDAKKATKESILKAKNYMTSDVFQLNALKLFMDGTGSGFTAYMKKNYKGRETKGCLYTSKEEVKKYLYLANENGLALHAHCCGDASLSMVLDVYEDAQNSGMQLDTRYSVEHLDTVAKEDIPRPAKLGISVNITPDFLAPTLRWRDNPYLEVYDSDVKDELWRWKSLFSTGVNMAFGTDYTASSMNPMDQLYRAVERKADDGFPENGYHPEEKMTLKEAVYCYTLGSAATLGQKDKLGSLEPGKYADFIILSQDIFKTPIEDLRSVQVLETYMNGKLVYKK